MPLSPEDLKLLLTVQPDTKEMDDAVRKLGADVDRVYQQAKVGTATWNKEQVAAIAGAVKSLGNQAREIERIKALSSPSLLRERVKLDNEELEARLKQTRELEKQRELLNPKFIKEMDDAVRKLGADVDRVYQQAKVGTATWNKEQVAAIAGAVKSLGNQAREIERIKALSSPSLLRERVKLDNEELEARLKQTRELEKQRELLNPKFIKERIKLEGEITASRERQQKAMEYARRGGTAGAVGRGVGRALTGAPIAGALGGLVSDLQSPLGPLTTVFKGVGGMFTGLGDQMAKMGTVGKALGGVMQGIGSGIGTILGVAGQLLGAIQTANPAVFEQFQIVLEDIVGVVGETLTPVLQLMIPIVRTLGDAIATILPSGEEMIHLLATMRPAINDLTAAFRDFWGEVGPLFRDYLIGYLKDLAGVAVIVARAIADVTRWLTQLLRTLGITSGQGASAVRGSTGAAARQAQISGIEQYQQQLQTSAFSIPGRASPVENIDSNVGIMTGILQGLGTTLGNIWGWLQNNLGPIFSGIGASIWSFAQGTWNSILTAINTVGDWLSRIFGRVGRILSAVNPQQAAEEFTGMSQEIVGEIAQVFQNAMDNPQRAAEQFWDNITYQSNQTAQAIQQAWENPSAGTIGNAALQIGLNATPIGILRGFFRSGPGQDPGPVLQEGEERQMRSAIRRQRPSGPSASPGPSPSPSPSPSGGTFDPLDPMGLRRNWGQ